MTRASERWQEKVRYAADTGTLPRNRVGRRSRLLIAMVAIVSTLGIVTYASRPSTSVPSPVVQPSLKVALATPEAATRRSFTPKVAVDAAPPVATPAQSQATTAPERVSLADPMTTGAVSTVASEKARAMATKARVSPQLRLSADQSTRERRPSKKVSSARVPPAQLRSRVASRSPEPVVDAVPPRSGFCLPFVVCF